MTTDERLNALIAPLATACETLCLKALRSLRADLAFRVSQGAPFVLIRFCPLTAGVFVTSPTGERSPTLGLFTGKDLSPAFDAAVSNYVERALALLPEDVADDTALELRAGGRLFLCVDTSPASVELRLLPSGTPRRTDEPNVMH